MVVIGHTRFQHFAYYGLLEIPAKGLWSEACFLIPRFANEAVSVFFVISGFLVGGRCIERVLNNKFEPAAFIIDRSSRIWLPLLPIVLITWWITWIRHEPIPWIEGIGNILSLQGIFVNSLTNNSSLWSLSYEIWFYILALGGAIAATSKSTKILISSHVLLIISLSIFTQLHAHYLFIWLAGAFSYFLDRRPNQWTLMISSAILTITSALGAAVVHEIQSVNMPTIVQHLPDREIFIMLLGLGISLLLPTLVGSYPHGVLLRKIENYGSSLASWSYSLYLVHFPILHLWGHWEGGDQLCLRVDGAGIGIYLLKVFSCLVSGYLFYLLFEKQTHRFRHYLKRYTNK